MLKFDRAPDRFVDEFSSASDFAQLPHGHGKNGDSNWFGGVMQAVSLTGLASAVVTSAAAQEQKADADLDLDLGPVKGTEELWYLLTALDTLIVSLAVIKDQAVIVQARREI